jgi:hypothetical protein
MSLAGLIIATLVNIFHKCSSTATYYLPWAQELHLEPQLEVSMFTIPYPTIAESRGFQRQAHKMRSAVVASLVRDFVRLISVAAR